MFSTPVRHKDFQFNEFKNILFPEKKTTTIFLGSTSLLFRISRDASTIKGHLTQLKDNHILRFLLVYTF